MRPSVITMLAAAILSSSVQMPAQDKDHRFMDRAEVRHGDNSATVTANSTRVLEQALIAVSEEYGWTADYEDPPYYSRYDLFDATAPAWLAQHPNGTRVFGVSGGLFQSQYPEDASTRSSAAQEEEILNKLVSDYNQSGNPGKFSIRREGPDRISITGTSVRDETGAIKEIPPVLDTLISLPSEAPEGVVTIERILTSLGAESGAKVLPGVIPPDLLRSKIASGGKNVLARTVLRQFLDATGHKLYWVLLYDANTKAYYLNVAPVARAEYDSSGNRRTVWVK